MQVEAYIYICSQEGEVMICIKSDKAEVHIDGNEKSAYVSARNVTANKYKEFRGKFALRIAIKWAAAQTGLNADSLIDAHLSR